MRAWLRRRHRRQAAQDVGLLLAPRVQRLVHTAAMAERDGWHRVAADLRMEAHLVQQVLGDVEQQLVGEQLTIWLGEP